MRAGERACACPECGVVCQGQFDGCPDVWARGPRPLTLTLNPSIEAPRVRALAAGPTQTQPTSSTPAPPAPPVPPAAASTGSNGNGNGTGGHYASAAPPPPPPPRAEPEARPQGSGGASRSEILQWFEDAFGELRNELHAVVSTVTRQQAMLAELLDSREAELRVVMVAESLPELAGEAAAKALADQSDGLAEILATSLDDLRASMQASDLSSVAVMDGMRELLRRVELTAEVSTEEAQLEGSARLEALKASVGRQIKPLTVAVAEVAAYIEVAEEREAARARALKASLTRQLQPLTAAVQSAVERSDQQMAEIHARLDALTPPKVPTPPKKAPTRKKAPTAVQAAPPRKAAPRKATAPKAAKTTKPRPAKPVSADPPALYDYESAPEPPVRGVLIRRNAAPRRPPLA